MAKSFRRPSISYNGAVAPLARFDDGTAAITANDIGLGHA